MKNRLKQLIDAGLVPLLLCVVYGAAMLWLAPGFGSLRNGQSLLEAFFPLFIVAAGQTVVLITAGIDLSVTSIIAVTSVTGAAIITQDQDPAANQSMAIPVAIFAMLLVGGTLGACNGVCVAYFRMPAFMVTLTSMMFLSGLAVWWTQSRSIGKLPDAFCNIGGHLWTSAVIALAIGGLIHVMLSASVQGVRLRAVGGSIDTARVSGVPVQRTIVSAYLICGLCAGIASVLITGELESGSPVQWENNLLDVIGATVIGGTSLYGGRGSVVWTAGGVLLLTLIDNSLNLLALSHFTIMMAKGGVILLAALLDALRYRTAHG